MPLETFWTPAQHAKKQADDEINAAVIEQAAAAEGESDDLSAELIAPESLAEDPATVDQIYDWYAAAISRRDREPLEYDRFVAHFFEGGSTEPLQAYGDMERGFLLGQQKYGVFIPTHFAPKTLRGGYDLMDTLGKSKKTPAVLAVTEDLSEMIERMPDWTKLDLGFLASFRDDSVEKDIVYNAHPDVRNLMLGLVAEYMNETAEYSEAA